ncbi:LOW QUALITY PROTEIN: nitric oxide-associated protein 1 [Eleginops maclovinus]|uniref:LOW QUALITY PROTEIN: nitric oxide-associated protein 1 n=1 Tax=Eleginops maclovinus TaxID=56733 RepID=UPI0030809970
MLKLLGVLRGVRVPAAARAGSLQGPVGGLLLGGRGLSGRAGRSFRGGCTVDPRLEENFVFVDFTDAEPEAEKDLLPPPSATPPSAAPSPQRLRALELQLHALGGEATMQGAGPETQGAELLFEDVDFPGGDSVASMKKKKKNKKSGWGVHRVVGVPDSSEPVSDTSCSGCGALLHCTAATAPGYLPSNKFKELQQGGGLGGATCQRCHLLTHHRQALQLQLSAQEYATVVRRLRPLQALLLLVVDLLDIPDSLPPDLLSMVGDNKRIVVLGNKVDLLPGDAPNYLQRIRRQLVAYCAAAGLHVSDVQLISAKTGFGVEELISRLQRTWSYRGDVYLVGSANAGKSSLFNALLQSDYCKSRATDRLQRATVSPWPGTTLDLLKFPIINPNPHRMFRREERLREEREGARELTGEERERLKHLSQEGYLIGHVGRTFRSSPPPKDEIQFDPDRLAFGEEEGETMKAAPPSSSRQQDSELRQGNWLYDTPGILKQRDVLGLLSQQEVTSVVPSQALVPRTFVLQPGSSLLVGGLARIDFLQGGGACWFSVLVSSQIPVHISSLERVQGVYQKHAGHQLLGVPAGGSERMKDFPPLVPQDFSLQGVGFKEAAADLKLSSAGWVAVTAAPGDQLTLRLHGPADAAFSLRTPPLLPHLVNLKGERIRKSVAYRTLKHAALQRKEQKKKK